MRVMARELLGLSEAPQRGGEMDTTTQTKAIRPKAAVRVALNPDVADALERRARRNDRFPWLEAGRILREALERDGDLPSEGSRVIASRPLSNKFPPGGIICHLDQLIDDAGMSDRLEAPIE